MWGESFLGNPDAYGLVSVNPIYKQLENCTRVTKLVFYRNFPSCDMDFSRCESLTSIWGYIQGGVDCNWILPNSLTSFYMGGPCKSPLITISNNDSDSNYSRLSSFGLESSGETPELLNDFFRQLSKCKNLTSISLLLRDYQGDYIDFEELDFSTLETNALNKISINRYSADLPVTMIRGINSSLTNLTTLEIENLVELSNIDGIENLSNLTNLTIANGKLKNCDNIGKLSKLKYLCLNNNSISNLYSLKNLHSLENLYIRNNAIYDTSININEEGTKEAFNNMEVLAELNYNSSKGNNLKGLWIRGNTGIVDYSLIKECSWPNGYDGF